MRKTWPHLCLLAAMLGLCCTALPAQGGQPAPVPGLRLLQAGAGCLVLEWVPPVPQLQRLPNGRIRVHVPGYSQSQQTGQAQLPFTSTLLILPPGASPQVQLLHLNEESRPLPGPLACAPRPGGVLRDGTGQIVGGALVTAAGACTTTSPGGPAHLEEIGRLRGLRLARLGLYPARPEGGQLRVVQHLRLALEWETPAAAAPHTPDRLQQFVRERALYAAAGPAASPTTTAPAAAPPPSALVDLAGRGIYRLPYEDLAPLGLAAGDPHNLRLFRGQDEVAWDWQGDEDAMFEPGEALLFYGEPRFSRWSELDSYRLLADDSPGLRMQAGSADPAGLPAGRAWIERLYEENHLYTPDCFCGHLPAGRDGDRWTWQLLRRPDPFQESFQYSFGLPDLEPGGAGQLTLWLIGYTALPAEPDHRVGVGLNGAPLGAVEWDGKRAVSATLEVPAALLQVEGNILGLTLTGLPDVPIEGAWLDAFALRYVRSIMPQGATAVFEGEAGRCAYSLALTDSGGLHAYDVSDPLRPRALSGFELQGNTVTLGDPEAGGGRRYYLAADCGLQRPPVRPQADPWSLNPGGAPPGTDWLAITPPQLAPALAPLLELRASQGLSVTLVNLEGIYDQWGDGQPDPEAIHALIAATYTWWSPRPSYVLLVGDGSFDPKQHRPDSPPTLLPPYLANVDPWAGETAADNRYACVDGDDALPDLLLGRLPVQDLAQAQEVVDKIVQYETAPASIPWKAQVLLVADDADASGDFPASSEAHAAALVRAPFYAARHYCSGTSDQQSDCPPAEAADIHRALLAGWGRGALLVQFIGHSSWHQWAVEKFFHLEDVSSLQNGPRLPIVLEMTCFTGAFQRPEATLDESLLCQAGGGAVAAWGPSGLGISAGHNQLSEGFFQAVFWGEAGTLGEAALAGKLALAAEGQNLDLLDTYNLLGDPALHLDLELPPWPGRVFVPLVYK